MSQMIDTEVAAGAAARDAGSAAEPDAAALGRAFFSDELLDRLMASVGEDGLRLTGPGGFISGMVGAVLERGLQAELTGHLGYERGDPAGAGSGNSRNGSSAKTVLTEIGPVRLEVPRDRNGSFTPRLVPKGVRRLGGLSDVIISLYAGGMTVRDLQFHLHKCYGIEVSHDTISKVTDAVLAEVQSWQSRPLDPVYPILYIDALVVTVREHNVVTNKSAHLVIGIDLQGTKHVLGIWLQTTEGAKFWAGVLAELRNRGVRDILIVCCDGLEGLPAAIEASFPHAVVQTCVVHLIRACMRYVSYADRKALAAALRPVYSAASVEAAETALLELAGSELGRRYPAAVATWERAWDRFVPFLGFPPEVRKIIYTTNAIESINYQLRKIIKNRGLFPNDAAVVKLLWLAILDIEDKRAWRRDKERAQGVPHHKRKAPARFVEGQATPGWTQALNALAIAYPGRIPEHAL